MNLRKTLSVMLHPSRTLTQLEHQESRLATLRQNKKRLKAQIASLENRRLYREVVPIFFVVGASRSGTNWLMRTLNRHPEVLCRGEGRFFGRNRRREELTKSGPGINVRQQPSSLYNALAEDGYLRLWVERSVWSRDNDTESQIDGLMGQAVRYFLSERLYETNKKMVGDKTPLPSPGTVAEISRICPDAKVIHIIRDGRDRVVSLEFFRWNRDVEEGGGIQLTPEQRRKRDSYRKDPEAFVSSGESIFTEESLRRGATQWGNYVASAREDGQLLGQNYTEVRYEALLSNPVEEFGRLFGFLGANDAETVVANCVEQTSFEKRSGGRQPGEEDSRSGVRKGIAGDWSRLFTDRDTHTFKQAAGKLLVQLGYDR
jgi:hypothetical protein